MATSAYSSAASQMSAKQLRKSMPLMDRFLVRENRLRNEIVTIGEGKVERLNDLQGRVVNPSAFRMYKNPFSGNWIPARLSLRRQAQLGKHAFAHGRFDELIEQVDRLNLGKRHLAGKKLNKMRDRIAELKAEEQEQIQRALSGEPENINIIQQTSKQTPGQVKQLAKALALTHGPYKGRSERNIFKGTIHARQAPAKKQNIHDRMAKMDQVIVDWKKQRKDLKTKAQPKLPF